MKLFQNGVGAKHLDYSDWAKPRLSSKQLFVKPAGKKTSWPQGLMIMDFLFKDRISNQSYVDKSSSACQPQ